MWDPAAVSRTQRRLHLPSEAARRYERAVDPAVSVAALDRCAALLADIAGGSVAPTLTDWRGDPPRDDWSLPQIQIAADLPDRIAGVAYAPGATARRLTQIGARCRPLTATRLIVTPPSWRPDLLQPADLVEEVLRLEGLEIIPSVLPPAPAGAGLTAGAKTQPCDRQVAGAVGLRRDPADAVSARRCLRPVGTAGRRPATGHDAGAQPPGGRPSAAGHHAAAGSAGSLGAQRVPWPGRCCVVCARAGGAARPQETRAVELIPVYRRPTDDEIAMLDASLPRQPQHVAVVLAGLREPRGPWGPGRPGRGRRCIRGGANHRPRQRSRRDSAGRPIPAVASGPLRRSADRGTPSSGMPASCIPR